MGEKRMEKKTVLTSLFSVSTVIIVFSFFLQVRVAGESTTPQCSILCSKCGALLPVKTHCNLV